MNFLSPKVVTPEGTRYTSLTNDYNIPIGSLAHTRDGRRFRFGRVGAAAADLAAPGAAVSGYVGTIAPFPEQLAIFGAGTFQPGKSAYTMQVAGAVPLQGGPYPANYFSTIHLLVPGGSATYYPCALAHHAAIPAAPGLPFTIELAADDGVPPSAAVLNMTRGYLMSSPYANLRGAYMGAGPVAPIAGFLAMPGQPFGYGWVQVGGPYLGIANVTTAIVRGQAVTLNSDMAFVTAAAGDQILGVAMADSQTPPGNFPQLIAVDLRIG